MEIRKTDRRQNFAPVDTDRRSGIDRRENPSLFYALEAIPAFRRTASLSDKIDSGDYLPAVGALGLTAINFKEDIRDMKSAGSQIYSKINKSHHYDPLYDRRNYQHSFSFTRGVIGEELLHKEKEAGNPFAKKIYDLDKTIEETKIGEWLTKKFIIKEADVKKIDKIKNFDGRCARAYKFESKVLGGKTIARAMKRTTLAGVVVMGLLETPKIIKETAKGDNIVEHIKNGAKQTIRAAANVAITTAGIGIGGAIGAKYFEAAGSLIGMGLGAIASTKAINKLQAVTGLDQ